MKKYIYLFMLFYLVSGLANAQIDEKISCFLTYYNNVSFEGMPTAEIDNKAHIMQPIFFIDNQNKKVYNSDKALIEKAVFTDNKILLDWDSAKVPRFSFLIDKKEKTIQFKAFYKLPPKLIGGSGVVMPASTTKSNGHGVCEFRKI